MSDQSLCQHIRQVFKNIRIGKFPDTLPDNAACSEELRELLEYFKGVQEFALAISNGDLTRSLKLKGAVAGSLKALQASLRHLAWQTTMIAGGDFTQKIDFMGELADAFNSMVQQLMEARERLKRQNEELETINKNIMDSIRYAQVIQSSLMPNAEHIRRHLPQSFFLWMPKDVVGGDMYFIEFYPDSFLIALMDCTGHGVPGALMTMIASSGLKRIVTDGGTTDPSLILQQLNMIVKTTLRQDTDEAVSDDGLDAAVCLVNRKERRLTFAGAQLPLYILHNGEVATIKGHRQSIGYKRSDLNFIFTNQIVPIQDGMSFYLSTDGFIDQVGGAKSFPFGSKRFINLLKESASQPFEEKQAYLLQAFHEYRGTHEQRDDITVAGFSIP